MKCIILAAGYATRLYPLTEHTAKPLLEVGGQSILGRLLNQVERIDRIDDVYIVTNDKFYPDFVDWASRYAGMKALHVINDGTTTNDNRLGAIADIDYVIQTADIADDVLVLAGDNVFDFALADFVRFFETVNADCVTTHRLDDPEKLTQIGIIEMDTDNKVTSFVEKPEHPESNLAVPPFYLYEKETLPLFARYIAEGNNPDAPGNFIPWLIERKVVFAWAFEGVCHDIGTLESYQEVQALYGG